MDKKDNFYKIPGGTLEEDESLEECAIRELKEETGFSCDLIKKLSTMKFKKGSDNNEIINIELNHYKAKLKSSIKNFNSFDYKEHFVSGLDIKDIKKNKYPVAPNINFLIEKKEII